MTAIDDALSVLLVPGAVAELRVLKVDGKKRTDSGYFDNPARLAAAATRYDGRADGIYMTLNPVNPALLARAANRVREWSELTTSDADTLRRVWLPLDFDPERPRGISSSEDEHEHAVQRAHTCRNWLLGLGWPAPVLADSGNGAHLLSRIDLPNDEASTVLVHKVIQVVDSMFGSADIAVDTGVFNAARIWKLYGTLARKGDNTPDRPHRRSSLIEIPETIGTVSRAQLEALAAQVPDAAPRTVGPRDQRLDEIKQRFDLLAYARAHFPGVDVAESSGERRIVGHGGLLVNPDRGVWYRHSEGVGGDAIELVGYVLYGATWDRHDAAVFRSVLEEAARVAGVPDANGIPRFVNSVNSVSASPHISGKTGGSASSVNSVNAWGAPISFHSYDLPAFPTAALPVPLRAMVEAEAEATQTPTDLAGLLALAVCATACAKKAIVRVKEGYTEPLNLFVAVTMPPGSRKSTVFSTMVAPLEQYEQEETARVTLAIAEAETRKKIAENALQRAQADAAKANRDTRADKELEAQMLTHELTAIEVPVAPRLIADDASAEKLSSLLRDHGGRMAVLSPEGDVFDLMAGRYSSGVPNFGVYLKGHAGDTLRVDRIGRGAEFVHAPALTVGVAIQNEVLRGFVDKPGFRGRGLLGRLLYALPPNRLGQRDTRPAPIPGTVRASYAQTIRQLLLLPFSTDVDGKPGPYVLRLAPAAEHCLQRFEAWIEPQLAEFGSLGTMTDWGGKLLGAVARISGLLHLATHAAAPWTVPIGLTTVEAAIQIGEYLIPHARAAYAEMGADPAIGAALHVLHWIDRMGNDTFTRREAFRVMQGRFDRVAAMEPILQLLIEHEFIRERTDTDPPRAGRRPSPTYEINPGFRADRIDRIDTTPETGGFDPTPRTPPEALTELTEFKTDDERTDEAYALGDEKRWPAAYALAQTITDDTRRVALLAELHELEVLM